LHGVLRIEQHSSVLFSKFVLDSREAHSNVAPIIRKAENVVAKLLCESGIIIDTFG
jgi:hypothetical protein